MYTIVYCILQYYFACIVASIKYYKLFSSLRILRNSIAAIIPVATAANTSAIGPAYKIPSIPIKSGKITTNGSRNKICRVRDKKIPFTGFPIEVKNVDVIGCIKFKKVKNKNTLK